MTALAAAPAWAAPTDWTLSVLAGNGTRGASNTSGAATSSPIGFLNSAVAADDAGNQYIADADRGLILKISSSGAISRIAGTGTIGSYSFSATPTSAVLAGPRGVAVRGGDVYFTDSGLVHKVSAGVLSVVAGGGATTASSSPIPGTSASLSQPGQLAFDAQGDLFIAEETGNRVDELTTGGQLSLVAGGGGTTPSSGPSIAATSAQLNYPRGLAVDADGDLFIANSLQNQVLEVAANGQLTVVVGSNLDRPYGLGVDDAGTLYIADYRNSRIKAFSGGTLSTIGGNGTGYPFGGTTPTPGPATNSPMTPGGLAVDADRAVYIGDIASQYTYKIAAPTAARPRAVTATAGDTQATVTWTAPAGTGSSAVTGYVVTPVDNGVAQSPQNFNSTALTQTITGLTNGHAYTFRVAAINTAGTGPVAASIAAVTPAAPVVPPAPPAGGGSSSSGGGSVTTLLPQTVTLSGPGSVPLTSGTARVGAVASAGGTISYSSSDPAVATVDSSGVLTLKAPGTTTVTANAAATSTHTSASASTTVTVTAAPKTSLPDGVTRLAGADRVATSVAVSEKVFADPEAGKSANVVIATSAKFADSIAGTRLAGQVSGPLLLTGTDELDGNVAAEVRRLVKKGGTVYILGQTEALTPRVKDALASLSSDYPIERVGGADRYETAAAIADEVTSQTGDVGPIYVVTGTDFADGVSVGAYAQRTGGVMLLTAGAKLPDVTAQYLKDHDPKGTRTLAVGGGAAKALAEGGFTAAAGKAVVGEDRYETSALLAGKYAELKTAANTSGKVVTVGIAGGASWPDALAGSAAMSHLDGPLLLTPTGTEQLAGSTSDALKGLSAGADRAVVFGGDKAVSDAALAQVKDLIKG